MDIIILLVLLAVLVIGTAVVGGILGIIALVRVVSVRKDLFRVRRDLEAVQSCLGGLQRPIPPATESLTAPVAAQSAERPPPGKVYAEALAAPPPLPPGITAGAAAGRPLAGPPPGPPEAMPAPAAPAGGRLERLESKIGQRWIAWVGAIVLFFSAAFFLKHAFENDWIGPTGQVVICALAGLAILACGSRFIVKGWRTLGQSLMGLGLAILYASFFAAFSLYAQPVMSQSTAFAFMVAVTLAGMVLAVLHNALTIAFLAVLGGVLAPVLVSTGQDARDALFTYLLLLNLGVLGVAFFRGWRLLDTLAMAGTFALYAGWYGKFYQPTSLGPALAWLGAFYVVLLALPFLYHLVRKRSFTIEQFIMALANAAFAAGFAWHMLREEYLFTMGFVALGMAAAYLALGAIIRRRLPEDARALFGVIAMTVTFLTLAVPLQLRAHGIMLAWVAEAPVLAYLAYRFGYRPVRVFAGAVLALAVGRLFLAEVHWPLHAGLFAPFINRQFISAMSVPAAAALYALIHHRFRAQATGLDRAMKLAAALGAGLVALIVLHAELHGWLKNDLSDHAAGSAVTALWAIGALLYLLSGARARQAAPWVWGVGAFVLGVAAVLGVAVFVQDLGAKHVLFANARFMANLLVMLSLLGYARVIGRATTARAGAAGVFAAIFFVAGVVGLLALLSAEAYSYCSDVIADYTRARRAGQMSITLVWGLYAASLLFLGFWKRWRPLRLGGLALFGVSALKLVLVDLTHLKDIYRIISFLVLGLLMLGASYLYHKLEKRLASPRSSPAPGSGQPVVGETK